MRGYMGGIVAVGLLCTSVIALGASATPVSVEQARQLLSGHANDPSFVVLDVRTPAEFSSGHLPGAVNLDALAKGFESRLSGLDPGKGYLVYCRTGNRSQKAVAAMERMGFRSIYHMQDGILGWGKP
jgi:rhodanese-related sulfurtransferase